MVLTDNGQKPEKTSKKAEGYPVYEKGWSNVEAKMRITAAPRFSITVKLFKGGAEMIRVLIVEDQRMAREDMENYIQSSGRYSLEASITNATMAETVCRQSRCELVLMDVCTEDDESGLVAKRAD